MSKTLQLLDRLTEARVYLSHDDMIRRGADGHLDKAVEAHVPLHKVVGREPVPASSEGKPYRKGQKITQPVEVAYDRHNDHYILYAGNHRVHQAEINGDSHIHAFVQPDGGLIGKHAKTHI
jgi:hypothetical protein